MVNNFSLNSIWISMGFTDFSFLFCLKIIFLIIFILLNIGLLYIEYLDRKHSNNSDAPLKSRVSKDLKRIATQTIIAVGLLSSTITLKNEYLSQEKKSEIRAEAQRQIAQSAEETKIITNLQTYTNFIHKKMHLTNIQNTFTVIPKYEEESSELKKAIK